MPPPSAKQRQLAAAQTKGHGTITEKKAISASDTAIDDLTTKLASANAYIAELEQQLAEKGAE